MKNPLLEFFENNHNKLIHKWMHYFDIYHKHFEAYRGKKITLVEFGVSHGGSLHMWKNYFGNNATIYGVDIDPRCKQLEEPGITILIGDQEDPQFLKEIATKIGPIDIIIDDGGHTMNQQITTFQELYPHVKNTGIFLVEDLHTSYWKEYGGGFEKPGTFIEFTKKLIDQLNAWHSENTQTFSVTGFTQTTYAIHLYDSIAVFEKGGIKKPHHEKRGIESF